LGKYERKTVGRRNENTQTEEIAPSELEKK
jgi:hypothetical protein